jgi:hypothetical protein
VSSKSAPGSPRTSIAKLRVLIVGGGVAALETALALATLAPRRKVPVAVTRGARPLGQPALMTPGIMRRLLLVSLVVPAATTCYRMVRRGIRTWGATKAEAAARLPGDELLEDADGVATRAIDIHAPASAVWPWLAQMGPAPRGGAYTYDWIENVLGLGMHSVARVLPEFQHPLVGDTIDFGNTSMRLERVESDHVLALRSQSGSWVWTFVLEEHHGRTRLLSRNRYRLPTLAARLGMVAMEPCSLVMERKMLLGIKQRAERLGVAIGRPTASAPTTEEHDAEANRTSEQTMSPRVYAHPQRETEGDPDVDNTLAAAPVG